MSLDVLVPPTFSGVVHVSQYGQVVFSQCYGYADIANERANSLNTRFPTASAGKGFVAAGILLLIQAGKLSLASRLGEVLPRDWQGIDSAITVEQLLAHTSGIPDYFDESIMQDYEQLWQDYPNYRVRSNMDLLPLFIKKPMLYPAGARFQYNNTGYAVLGMMIEAITGQPFDVYLQSSVFSPCGMADTGYFELDKLPVNCANAYIFDAGRSAWRTNIYSVDAKGTGAGGAFTTADDMVGFWQTLMGGGLIREPLLSAMTTPGLSPGNYGYGLWIDQLPDGTNGYHLEGCDPGVSFISAYQPSTHRIITLVSNTGDDVWTLNKAIFAALI